MISRETIRQLKETVRIEDVIVRCGVPLTRVGPRLKACCPFADHQDDTPSFFVFPHTQTFQCFGQCGRGGDVLDFLQEWYGCTFRSAVDRLSGGEFGGHPSVAYTTRSHVVGKVIRSVLESRADGNDTREKHTHILTVAGNIYHHSLLRQPRILAYIYKRGILPESIQMQRLGFADGNTFPEYAASNPHLAEAARNSGLLTADGRETLAGRLVFPEVRKEVIWYLIGRAVPPHPSKYKYLGLPIAKPLMGYGEAKSQMETEYPRRRGILVTEGAIDRIIALQWRLPVYPLAFISAWPSAYQLRELLDLYEQSGGATVLLGLDDDEAGHTATVALLNALRKPGIPATVAATTGGKDLGAMGLLLDGRRRYLPSLVSALAEGERL